MTEVNTHRQERFNATRRVALVGAGVNLLLAVSKTVIGFLAQSSALIADGVHSLSDLLSDGLVYIAAKHAAQGPDEDHPYGHGRFETAGTLGLAILLFLAAVGIIWDAAARLVDPDTLMTPSVIAIYAALFSILANEFLYQYTMRVGRSIKSDLLKANAWHHRTDAISSVVVLAGVGGTMFGFVYLDAIAAIGVGLMIAQVGWELGWPALQELVDEGMEESDLKQIEEIISGISGVQALHMLRTRKIGGQAAADVHILVDSKISVSEGHMISQTVIDKMLEEIEPMSDVTVHIDPEDDEVAIPCQGLPLRVEAKKLLRDTLESIEEYTNPDEIVLHYLAGRIDVDFYWPLSQFESQEQTSQLLNAIQSAIEPLGQFGEIRVFYG